MVRCRTIVLKFRARFEMILLPLAWGRHKYQVEAGAGMDAEQFSKSSSSADDVDMDAKRPSGTHFTSSPWDSYTDRYKYYRRSLALNKKNEHSIFHIFLLFYNRAFCSYEIYLVFRFFCVFIAKFLKQNRNILF